MGQLRIARSLRLAETSPKTAAHSVTQCLACYARRLLARQHSRRLVECRSHLSKQPTVSILPRPIEYKRWTVRVRASSQSQPQVPSFVDNFEDRLALCVSGMLNNSARSDSACFKICEKALPRWLISITLVPDPCQFSKSACACSRTGSGKHAGPAAKLYTRPNGCLCTAIGAASAAIACAGTVLRLC